MSATTDRYTGPEAAAGLRAQRPAGSKRVSHMVAKAGGERAVREACDFMPRARSAGVMRCVRRHSSPAKPPLKVVLKSKHERGGK